MYNTLSLTKIKQLPWDKNAGVCLVISLKDFSCCATLFSVSWIINFIKLHLLLPMSSTLTHQSCLIGFPTKPWDPQYNWGLVCFINFLEQGNLSQGSQIVLLMCSRFFFVIYSMINDIATFTKPIWSKTFLRLYDNLKKHTKKNKKQEVYHAAWMIASYSLTLLLIQWWWVRHTGT